MADGDYFPPPAKSRLWNEEGCVVVRHAHTSSPTAHLLDELALVSWQPHGHGGSIESEPYTKG
jgi:hypothetical protein